MTVCRQRPYHTHPPKQINHSVVMAPQRGVSSCSRSRRSHSPGGRSSRKNCTGRILFHPGCFLLRAGCILFHAGCILLRTGCVLLPSVSQRLHSVPHRLHSAPLHSAPHRLHSAHRPHSSLPGLHPECELQKHIFFRSGVCEKRYNLKNVFYVDL